MGAGVGKTREKSGTKSRMHCVQQIKLLRSISYYPAFAASGLQGSSCRRHAGHIATPPFVRSCFDP
jgi:hypothetical protein